MKRSLSVAGGFLLGLSTVASLAAPWYTHSYEGSVLPTAASPAWTELYAANTYASIIDGNFLRLDSIGSTSLRPQYNLAGAEGGAWDLSTSDAFTFQMRARVVDNTGFANAFSLILGTGATGAGERQTMGVRTNNFTFGNQNVALDATEWHVYHVSAEKVGTADWTFTLRIDDNERTWTHVGYATSVTYGVIVGDTSASGTTMGGIVEIDYLRWNLTEALPILTPPRGTLMLLR